MGRANSMARCSSRVQLGGSFDPSDSASLLRARGVVCARCESSLLVCSQAEREFTTPHDTVTLHCGNKSRTTYSQTSLHIDRCQPGLAMNYQSRMSIHAGMRI